MWIAVLPLAIIMLCPIIEVGGDCSDTAADIVFILDSSGSVGSDNFQKMREFFKAMVDGFQIGSSFVRIGSVTFSSSVHDTFQLTEYYTKSQLKSRISSIPFFSGGTDTAAAILYARTISFSSQYSRPIVTKIAVVITDGQSNSKPATLSEAELLRNNKVIIFSVGVGDGVDMAELEGMASNKSYVFDASSFDALDSLREKLTKTTCEVISCEHPGTPLNGYLNGSDFSSGKSVIYGCYNEYKLIGDRQRTCLSNKTWSGNLPTCLSNPCPNVTIPRNGALVCNGWKREFTQFCVIFCQIGTQLSSGNDFSTRYICGGCGQWLPTGNLPSCELSHVLPSTKDRLYYFNVCEANDKVRMKKGYLWILQNSDFKFLCTNYGDLCKLENVDVQC